FVPHLQRNTNSYGSTVAERSFATGKLLQKSIGRRLGAAAAKCKKNLFLIAVGAAPGQIAAMSSSARRALGLICTLYALFSCRTPLDMGQAAETGKAVGDTKFSQHRGFFDSPFVVEITTKTRGAKIYYTTNGVEPTERSGSLYTEPVRITTTTVLRA